MAVASYRAIQGGWRSLDDGHIIPVDATPTPLAPLWGIAYGSNSIPTIHETAAGRPVGVRRSYWENNQAAAGVAAAAADVAANRVPWVSWKLPHSWAQAAGGADDAWAQSICAQLGDLDGPVMLTWHHEPEGDDSPLSDFVRMHDRLYTFSQPYPNIRCGPILTLYDELYSGGTLAPSLDTLWPGSFASGDFLGFDTYCGYLSAKGGKWLFLGPTYFQQAAEFCARKGVKWAVGEYGISAGAAGYNRSTAITGGNANGTVGGDVSWLREVMNTATSLGDCLALCYFDSGIHSTTNVASTFCPAPLVGQPAWPLTDFNAGGYTWIADTGTPSKYAVWLDILKSSPAPISDWSGYH